MKTRTALALLLCSVVPVSITFATHAPKTYASHNWAGYVAQGEGYSAVEGSWMVPTVPASQATSASAAWVGIGGMQSSDLIQTGIRARSEGGTTTYEAWYELYPAPAVPVAITVHAGDSMHASLEEGASGMWQITLADTTTGETFSTLLPYRSAGTSAEWVVEAPGTASGALLALSDFDAIPFTAAHATKGGVSESPAALGAAGLSLVDASGASLALPSPLSAEGTSFTVHHAR